MTSPAFGRRAALVAVAMGIGPSLLSPCHADAAEPRLTAEVLTDFPMGIGGALDAEWPYRIRSSVSLQYLPSAYVSAAEATAQQIGGYDDITSALVRASAKNALVLRVHGGWRPFESLGLYADVGYTLLALGGDVSTEDLARAAGASGAPGRGTSWDLSSTSHLVDVQVGWRFEVAGRFSVRAAVGFAFTVAASSTIEPVAPARPAVAQAVADAGEVYLEETFVAYVHTPTLSLAAGWDFFH